MRSLAQLLIITFAISITSSGCREAAGKTVAEKLEINRTNVISVARENLIFVQGGTFLMGDFGAVGKDGMWRPYFPPAAQWNQAHEVTLSDFSLSRYEITWFEYDTYRLANDKPVVITLNQQEIPREPYDRDPESIFNIDYPAMVNWHEAKAFCLWLAKETGLPFDLPTSAQWEFAARNRGSTDWIFATHDGKAVEHGNKYADAIYEHGHFGPVGTRLPANPLGFFDMAENAEEWVNDWYSDTHYRDRPHVTDPKGPSGGTEKVVRGLGAGSLAFSFSRQKRHPTSTNGWDSKAGFRCAVPSQKAPNADDKP